MQKITPYFWFNGQAEEAASFYTSIFKNSKMGAISYYGEDMPGEKGTVLTVSFKLEGQEFVALNGGPEFHFTPAVSFLVDCKTQEEVDWYWDKLSEGGVEDQCGWLRDKFGISWQIVPQILDEMLNDPDPVKSGRVMQAMLRMVKLDIPLLQKAFQGD